MRFFASHPVALLLAWATPLAMSLTEIELYLQVVALALGIIVATLTAIAKWYEIVETRDDLRDREAEQALDKTDHAQTT